MTHVTDDHMFILEYLAVHRTSQERNRHQEWRHIMTAIIGGKKRNGRTRNIFMKEETMTHHGAFFTKSSQICGYWAIKKRLYDGETPNFLTEQSFQLNFLTEQSFQLNFLTEQSFQLFLPFVSFDSQSEPLNPWQSTEIFLNYSEGIL